MVAVDEARAWLQGRITVRRYDHSCRVAELAAALAERHRVDPEHAFLAGLLHDSARELPGAELLERARELKLPIGEVEQKVPMLLHGQVGAELVRRELGVSQPHILDAIRFHTTGRVGMSPLEKLLFVADYAEPARDFPGVRNVRSLLFDDLEGALRLALDQILLYLLREGRLLHPNTVAARNALYI